MTTLVIVGACLGVALLFVFMFGAMAAGARSDEAAKAHWGHLSNVAAELRNRKGRKA